MRPVLKLIGKLTAGALLLGSTSLVSAASANPGYLDFESLSFLAGREPNVEVNLHGPVLKMLAQLPIEYEDGGEAVELLRVLEQVLVRIYNTDSDAIPDTLAYIDDTSRELEQQEWMRIVRVRDEGDSNVDIHVRMSDDGENLYGLVIMAVEGKGPDAELVFVNIAGNFNPAYLANLGSQFDIDYLGDIEIPEQEQ